MFEIKIFENFQISLMKFKYQVTEKISVNLNILFKHSIKSLIKIFLNLNLLQISKFSFALSFASALFLN